MSQTKAQLVQPVGIVTGTGINVTGVITATSFVGSGEGLTGVASTDNIITGTAATFNNTVQVNSTLTANSGFTTNAINTNLNVTGVTTIASAKILTGFTTNATNTNLKVTGVSTIATLKVSGYSSNNDDVWSYWGTGQDMGIKYDGTNGYFRNSSGDIYIDSANADSGQSIYLQPRRGENSGKFIANGAVELYYDNAKKLNTTTSGVVVAGVCTAGIVTATTLYGDGSNITGISACALLGHASCHGN